MVLFRMIRKFKKSLKSGQRGIPPPSSESHYVVGESKMERKFPYHSKNMATLSKEQKEKLTPEEKHWIINRDMNMQVSNVDSFGSFALIFLALVCVWMFSDSEIA